LDLEKEASSFDLLRGMQVMQPPLSRITGLGIHLPEQVVDNEQMAQMVDAPKRLKRLLPPLIQKVTGIKTRRFAPPGTAPSDLAADAARSALDAAGLAPESIDTLIFASTDQDAIEPATANIVQQKLNLPLTNAFDLSNACNSFVQALKVANALIACRAAQRVLIAVGEVCSYVRTKSVADMGELRYKMGGLTLGDAGAAVVVEKSGDDRGFTEMNLQNLGEYWSLCRVPADTGWRDEELGRSHGSFYLDMPELAKVVRKYIGPYVRSYEAFRKETHGEESVKEKLALVIPHQISKKFIQELAGSFTAVNKMMITADYLGNTGSASIPVALHLALEQGLIAHGSDQEILLFAAASGYSIGHIRMRL
jgi:3-oxoacyl-[acyl-carrier-protein] synthase-3